MPHDYDALPNDAHAPSFKQELRVVAVLVGFIILLEIIARIIAPTLDYDREHIHAFPSVIEDLEKRAGESGKPRVVFFGNSLMMHGLQEETVHQELAAIGGPEIESTKITPVGTAMLDWVYLYRRYFETEGSHPDLIVVGFVAHHIHDQEPIKLRRLSRHFVTTKDLPNLWKTEDMGFHQTAQSILCNISALEGDQPEHQLGILYTVVSDYRNGVNKNNQLISAAAERRAKESGHASGQAKETYQRMERFIQRCKEYGVEVWFVPMPQPEVWDYNEAATELAEKYGMKVLDARSIDGMTEADFSDGYHLGETGGEKFSKWMAGQLKQHMP
ncbi:MAG: SGNH/GDSL hydrolase family protein [Akkermansiaceae bacterium]|nr:SGNH/GDSL hydrolase family protein [Akkermansiaceae bacterium]